MTVHEGVSSFETVFAIAGSFDRLAAARLRERFDELPEDATVLVDFTRAHDVSDLAIGILAVAFVAPHRPRVILRGVTHHQACLFRYLGSGGFVLESGESGHPPGADGGP